MKQLAIVVPYRAREAHLKAFVPALRAYFTRDKLDRDIPYRVLIIEQSSDLPFNRGALRNIGFKLACAETDYVCFHDVDYLPIWADYRWSDVPTRIIWYGAERCAIAPGQSNLAAVHDPVTFFGGVVLMPNAIFEQVNGYANSYWGWGYEDNDLRERLIASGIHIGSRDGTFQPLQHDNEGYRLDGSMTPIATVNGQIGKSRWLAGADNAMQADGLKNVSYEIVSRVPIPDTPGQRPAVWEKITVKLLMRPSPEQLEAIGNKAAASPAGVWTASVSRGG
jgi:glycosyl transferase family 7 (putative galactosyltransferase)